MSSKKIIIVGAGFGGLTLGALLARQGMRVCILEKNEDPGGRARVWRSGGYSFDMGPTWYLMPEVFEEFFALFGRRREEFYRLAALDPSYRVFFGKGEVVDIVPELAKNLATFERLEPGGASRLQAYLADARYKYEIALKDFLYRDYTSIFQFFNRRMIVEGMRLNVFQGLDQYTRRFFTDRRARQLLEYHMVFLGNSPDRAPALYSLMSHADLNLGVFYPMPVAGPDGTSGVGRTSGIGAVVEALLDLNRGLGVEILTGREVDRIEVRGGTAQGVHLKDGGELAADVVAVNADYHHADTSLLAAEHRSYSARYWERRVIAPSMLLLYLGLDRRMRSLAHHSLYFAEDWNAHFASITERPAWPEQPCFYLCAPARTDPGVAPPGGESLMVLVPIAPGLPDTAEIRASYREKVLDHVEAVIGERVRDAIRVERIFTLNDFSSAYNAYKGTALGLAHTLLQTAVFRPAHRSRKVSDLWYTGGYTHPGIGVPMAFISSRIIANEIARGRRLMPVAAGMPRGTVAAGMPRATVAAGMPRATVAAGMPRATVAAGMPRATVAVVGAGLGGMAAAIRLRTAGVDVDVFEQSDVTGGKAATTSLGGYRFDTGPSLLTMPFVFRRLFEEAGERLDDHLTLVPLEPLCTNVFPDGSVLRDSSDRDQFARELGRLCSDPAESLFRYLEHGRRIYDASAHLFLFRGIQEAILRGGARMKDLLALPRLDALRSLHRANAAAFRDPRLVQLFDRFATYNGSDPWRAPATLAIIAAVEYGFGGFSVRGGIRQIPLAYERLARKLGVRFFLGRRVERILVENGRARGLRVGGSAIHFDAVISNADVLATYRHLLADPREPLARRYELLEPSTSGLIFLWGMRGEFPELSVSSVFFPDDYRAEFRDLFERSRCPADPAVFVNVTSKVPGTSDAPPGCENWFVMVNAPADRGQDWPAEISRARAAVLARLTKALGRDVEKLIEVEVVITPVDIERRTGSTRGSLYGISSNSRLAAFLRHPNRHPRIRGLYFCGGSAHPGGGMPLVTLSGLIAADLLLKHETKSAEDRGRWNAAEDRGRGGIAR